MSGTTRPPDIERIAVLESQMQDVRDDVKAIREGQERLDEKITALSDQLTGTRGKIQGAVAVLGLLGAGGLLHWAATMVNGMLHGGAH